MAGAAGGRVVVGAAADAYVREHNTIGRIKDWRLQGKARREPEQAD